MNKKRGKVIAIVVAAGKGKRMGKGFNKQYIPIKGKPIIAYTLEVFEKNQYIDEIILVVAKEEIVLAKKDIIDKYSFKKVTQVIEGGKERQDSVYKGILAAGEECEILLIHDGARPFVQQEVIKKTIEEAKRFGAAIVAVPVKETIKRVNSQMEVVDTPDRSQLWVVQTPQVFQYSLLKKAYEKLQNNKVFATDDAVALERLGYTVKVVEGSYENIKITTPDDIIIAEAILHKEGK